MDYRLFIPPTLQYGADAQSDARTGRMTRNLQQVLIRTFFGGSAEGEDAKASAGDAQNRADADFETVVARFAGELAFLDLGRGVDADRRAKLWRAILDEQRALATEQKALDAAKQTTTGDDADEDEADPRSADQLAMEALFCLALQALCGAFAAAHLDRRQSAEADGDEPETGAEDPDEEDEHLVLDDAAAEGAPRLAVGFAFARRMLAEHLQRQCRHLLADTAPDKVDLDIGLLSEIALDCLLAAMTDRLAVEQRAPGRPRHIVVTRPDHIERFLKVAAAMPSGFTPQPLRAPVRYPSRQDGDTPTVSDADRRQAGTIVIDLIGYRRSNGFLRRFHKAMAAEAPKAFDRYIDALNAQMAVAWRLNLDVLSAVRALIARASAEDLEEPVGQWARQALYRPVRKGPRTIYALPAEFLDHPLMQAALEELAAPDEAGGQRAFYLPWRADYRGRIYAATPWLTPQGGDVQRALFEFADGAPLTDDGWRALRHHGGNLVGKKRLLADLGITDRIAVTLDDRERWVRMHEDRIRASAQTPCDEPWWREVASGSELQFLAFCMAYSRALDDPDAPVHLPVQIDGTCNGLQHIAALTGDVELAKAVNVLRDGDLPRDIYSELAEDARRRMLSGETTSMLSDKVQPLVQAWLPQSGLLERLFGRGAAKKVIMTIPYGAGDAAQVEHVLDQIVPELEPYVSERTAENAAILDCLEAAASRPGLYIDVHRGLRRVYRRWRREKLLARRASADLSRAEAATALPPRDQDPLDLPLFHLGVRLSMLIVEHLQESLRERYDSVRRFKAFLRGTGTTLFGMPLLWTTPLGFPVCQDKFQLVGLAASAHFVTADTSGKTGRAARKRSVKLDGRKLGEGLDGEAARGQRSALMPNLIHAFDATHLAMILRAAHYKGIALGTIHDCLLCHPNAVPTLRHVVTSTFARLHAGAASDRHDAFSAWCEWMELLRRLREARSPISINKAIEDPGGPAEQLLRKPPTRSVEADQVGKPTKIDTLDINEEILSMINEYRESAPEKVPVSKIILQFIGQPLATKKDREDREKHFGKKTESIMYPFFGTLFKDGRDDMMSEYFFS